jgi:GTP-binding protein HflX
VLAEDKLFATLDPTLRNVTLSGGHDVLLSDTVGFISDLPTELVAAFSATLEEVSSADMIIHVRDIAHPEADSQFRNVVDILEKLGALENKDIIEVWNKSDLLSEQDQERLLNVGERKKDIYLVSAEKKIGLDDLLQGILDKIMKNFFIDNVDLLLSAWSERVWLYKNIKVISEVSKDNRLVMCVNWSKEQKKTFYSKFY